MSRVALLAVIPLLLACSKKDEAPPADVGSTNMNLAGRWSVQVMPESRDSTLLIFMLDASNTATGWKMTLPNRQPMDVRVVTMSNDSIVFENDKFPSALEPGVMVKTSTTAALVADTLIGRTTAHYDVKGPDSVRVLRLKGVRQ